MKKLCSLIVFILISQFLTGCVARKEVAENLKPFSLRRMEVTKNMLMREVASIMKEDPDQVVSSNHREIWIYEHEIIENNHSNMKRLQNFSVRFDNNRVDYLGYFSCYIPLQ